LGIVALLVIVMNMKTALVTGVSKGIGEAVAQLLLENNWKVYGVSRNRPVTPHDNLVWLQSDLTNPSAIAAITKQIAEKNIDLLVSNAGVAFQELASLTTSASYRKMFDLNVLAPMLLVSELKDKIETSTIISISSVSDRIAENDFALYCSSKAANTRYFESLAKDLNRAKVYTLLPDYVDTPMLRVLQEGGDFNWEETMSAMDVADLCLQFADEVILAPSGSNIIIVNNALIGDLDSVEQLFGYNTDTKALTRL
jgi:NAD(P)-dependent dehydrogenase (short-subunit alcohol dehydrogenase family)